MATQDPQTSTLHPEMVYQPPSPTRVVDDNDGAVKPLKFAFHARALARFLIFVFTLTGIGLSFSVRYGVRDGAIFAVVMLFITLFWTTFTLLHYLHGASRKRGLPSISLPKFRFQLGSCHLSCGEGDDDDAGDQVSEGQRLLDDREAPRRPAVGGWKNSPRLVDLTLGTLLFIAGMVQHATSFSWYGRGPESVMTLLVSALEISVFLMSFFKAFGPVTVTITPDEDDEESQRYRIRLPEARRGTGADSKLSVVA